MRQQKNLEIPFVVETAGEERPVKAGEAGEGMVQTGVQTGEQSVQTGEQSGEQTGEQSGEQTGERSLASRQESGFGV